MELDDGAYREGIAGRESLFSGCRFLNDGKSEDRLR